VSSSRQARESRVANPVAGMGEVLVRRKGGMVRNLAVPRSVSANALACAGSLLAAEASVAAVEGPAECQRGAGFIIAIASHIQSHREQPGEVVAEAGAEHRVAGAEGLVTGQIE